MKNNLLFTALTFVAVTANINATENKMDSSKLAEIRAMNTILQQPNLQVENAIDLNDVYLLKMKAKSQRGSQKFTAFVDKNTSRVYFGNGFEKDGSLISFPANAELVKSGVSFSYGNGKKEIYLVTDPQCPYCIRFEKEMDGKLDDYRVHVLLYPLPFHKKAPAMTEWILSAKSDAQKHARFQAIMSGKSKEYTALIKDKKKAFQYSPETKALISKSMKAVEELGARGTPMVFDSAFKQVPRAVLLKKTPETNSSVAK